MGDWEIWKTNLTFWKRAPLYDLSKTFRWFFSFEFSLLWSTGLFTLSCASFPDTFSDIEHWIYLILNLLYDIRNWFTPLYIYFLSFLGLTCLFVFYPAFPFISYDKIFNSASFGQWIPSLHFVVHFQTPSISRDQLNFD